MYYDLIVAKPRINKFKVAGAILIVIAIISLSIFGGIQCAKHKRNMIEKEELEKEIQKELEIQEQIAEQTRIEQEEEAKKLKNAEPLTRRTNSINTKYIFI
jgi:hypothetical protein